MPNGRNAGRLFPDCVNEHGYGESHPVPEGLPVGGVFRCRVCNTWLKKTEEGLVLPERAEIVAEVTRNMRGD